MCIECAEKMKIHIADKSTTEKEWKNGDEEREKKKHAVLGLHDCIELCLCMDRTKYPSK